MLGRQHPLIPGTADQEQKHLDTFEKLMAENRVRPTALSPIWYDAVLKPASGWQFNSFYKVALTDLTCPRGVDLEAASTP